MLVPGNSRREAEAIDLRSFRSARLPSHEMPGIQFANRGANEPRSLYDRAESRGREFNPTPSWAGEIMRKLLIGAAVCLGIVAVAIVATGVKAGPEYGLRCGAISSGGFALLKFDRNSGKSWTAVQAHEWKPVQEPASPPAGTYEVHVEQYATKDAAGKDTTEWQMFRINNTTGQCWVLMSRGEGPQQESRWQEIAEAN